MKKSILLLLSVFAGSACQAQQAVSMADTMRSEGKIYVVAGVLVLIFAVLAIYLVVIDRKVASIERKIKKHDTP